MSDGPHRRFFSYGIAILSVAVVIAGRWLLEPVLGENFVYAPCLLAVVASGWYGGRGPALAAVGLGAFGSQMILAFPSEVPAEGHGVDLGGLSLFVVSGAVVAWLSGAMHAARCALETANRLLEQRVEGRTEELAQAVARYRDSEERFGLAMTSSGIGCFELNLNDHSAHSTPEHARIFGYDQPPEAWSLERFLSHVHPDDRVGVEAQVRAGIAAGAGWEFACRIHRTDGEERWIEVVAGPHLNPDGRLRCIAGTVQDITARKHTELALEENERLLRIVTGHARVGLVVVGPGYRYLFANEAYAEVLGLTTGGIVGRRVPELLPAAWPAIQPRLDRALSGERVEYELETPAAGGEVHQFTVTYEPRPRDTGTFDVVVVVIDITARKSAEAAAIRMNERIRLATRAARLGIWDWRIRENQIEWDDQMYALYGCRRGDFAGAYEAWLAGIHPEDRERCNRESQDARDGLRDYESEFRVIWPDGTVRYIQALGEVYRDADGEAVRMVGVNLDVTSIKAAELEVRASRAQLLQAQKMEAVGQLAGGIAHDFNNLMMVISGYCESLVEGTPSDREYHDAIVEIQRAGARASELTQQLLAFSRKQVLAPQVLDLNGLVAGMEGMLKRLIGEDVNLITVLGASTPRVKVDPGQMHQVIMNIAVNARDAMPQGGKLTIETSQVEIDESLIALRPDATPGSYALLAISDTGGGMEPAVRERIFEPFFSTKGVARGTGLGLSVVHGIVKQSGGRVDVYSEPGIGTTFKIYLPATPEDVKIAAAADPSAHQGGNETILLVEDEHAVREITTKALKRLGYQVLTASNGSEALALAAAGAGEGIQMLITDVVMPDISGRKVAETLIARNPALKVLFVSGYTDDVIVRHGVLQADVSFLQKPFSFRSLANKIREVLDRD